MNLFFLWYVVLCLLFIAFTVIYVLVWKGLNTLSFPASGAKEKISVIVAARNEARSIARCLDALIRLDYPRDFYELIVINDRSTDSTGEILKEYALRHTFLTVETIDKIDSDLPPKKNALIKGIQRSRFDILVFTDADSFVHPGWLNEISSAMSPDVGLVAGYSPFEFTASPSMWDRIAHQFLRYEELKNTIGAAASIGLGYGHMCTGRNLAYRKKVFEEVGGYEKIKHSVSGDDDLFLQTVRKNTRWKLRYLTSPSSYVTTLPPSSWREFIQQRIRHFSAGKYYPLNMKAIYGAVNLYSFLMLVTLFLFPAFGFFLLFMTFLVQYPTISKAAKLFHEPVRFDQFVFGEFLSILYMISIGPRGYFGSFEWKGASR